MAGVKFPPVGGVESICGRTLFLGEGVLSEGCQVAGVVLLQEAHYFQGRAHP